MSLNSFDESRAHGQPVEIYEFVYGENEGDTFRYTDAEFEITYDEKTFSPLPIERDDIDMNGRMKSTALKIKVPSTSGIATLFNGYPPRRVIEVRIWESHIGEFDTPSEWVANAEFQLLWIGRVLEMSRKQRITTVACDTNGNGMKRNGLNRFYQRHCPFRLFHAGRCGASEAAATTSGTVASVDGDTVVLDSGWIKSGLVAADYIGGTLRWTGDHGTESRKIIGVSGNTLEIDTPAFDLAATDSVETILGCNRTQDHCERLHDTITTFGGFPYIPLKNPLNKNNHT